MVAVMAGRAQTFQTSPPARGVFVSVIRPRLLGVRTHKHKHAIFAFGAHAVCSSKGATPTSLQSSEDNEGKVLPAAHNVVNLARALVIRWRTEHPMTDVPR